MIRSAPNLVAINTEARYSLANGKVSGVRLMIQNREIVQSSAQGDEMDAKNKEVDLLVSMTLQEAIGLVVEIHSTDKATFMFRRESRLRMRWPQPLYRMPCGPPLAPWHYQIAHFGWSPIRSSNKSCYAMVMSADYIML